MQSLGKYPGIVAKCSDGKLRGYHYATVTSMDPRVMVWARVDGAFRIRAGYALSVETMDNDAEEVAVRIVAMLEGRAELPILGTTYWMTTRAARAFYKKWLGDKMPPPD